LGVKLQCTFGYFHRIILDNRPVNIGISNQVIIQTLFQISNRLIVGRTEITI
jgi:hypothetical protein